MKGKRRKEGEKKMRGMKGKGKRGRRGQGEVVRIPWDMIMGHDNR